MAPGSGPPGGAALQSHLGARESGIQGPRPRRTRSLQRETGLAKAQRERAVGKGSRSWLKGKSGEEERGEIGGGRRRKERRHAVQSRWRWTARAAGEEEEDLWPLGDHSSISAENRAGEGATKERERERVWQRLWLKAALEDITGSCSCIPVRSPLLVPSIRPWQSICTQHSPSVLGEKPKSTTLCIYMLVLCAGISAAGIRNSWHSWAPNTSLTSLAGSPTSTP